MKEQGESGDGSLEPGIGSGEEFVVCYPNRFLEFYYAANPIDEGTELENSPQDGENANEPATAGKKAKVEVKPAIFQHLTLEHSKLVMSGARRGEYTNVYKCARPRIAPSSIARSSCCASLHRADRA